ncbi:MAG: hypothetical protein DME17_04975 [Candidatus Rokuibacteriota bacterium]|nr:MAG: hypothetical protein DME17_04975 [Candidatus Rokubacteria bacterium]
MAAILNAGASIFDKALDDFLGEALKIFEDRLRHEGSADGTVEVRELGARQFVDFLFGRFQPASGGGARRGKRS